MLSIPDSLWDQMLDALATTASGLERVAYLDGIRWTDRAGRRHGAVTTITLPDAELSAGHYRVSGDAITRASEHLFAHGLIRLAQVHTHGDQCTDHSPVDDARAYSQRDGALSLVLPYHAVRRPRPAQASVHERSATGWTRLQPGQINETLRLVPALVDQRPQLPAKVSITEPRSRKWPQSESATDTKATSAADSARSTHTSRSWFASKFLRRTRH